MIWLWMAFCLGWVICGERALAAQANNILSGYAEFGERSTSEDYQEEDTDDNYSYRSYHLKFKQKVSDRLSYDISSFFRNKDYSTKDSLDSISRIFKTNYSYYIKKSKEESLRSDLKLQYREKRFDNTPNSEYNQRRASYGFVFDKGDIYTLNFTSGIDDFDYLNSGNKDQLKVFTKFGGKRYLFGKRLELISSYKIEAAKQEALNRKKTKNEIEGGFDYIFDSPLIDKIMARLEWAQKDTKAEEERDEDLDYEYWNYYLKSEHTITPKLDTGLKYQGFEKDYLASDLDHQGFSIRNNWVYEILDTKKQRLGLELGVGYKAVDYGLAADNSYKKESVEIKASYQQKKDWQASASIEENFYSFNISANDKKRYYLLLSGEKLFKGGDVALTLDFKYKYTDFARKTNTRQEALRVGFDYKF